MRGYTVPQYVFGQVQSKEFVVEQKLTKDSDEIFVNGGSFIPKAKSLDTVFKNQMFGGVEA